MSLKLLDKITLLKIINSIGKLTQDSKIKFDYLKSLHPHYFILIQALYWLGRSGWEKKYFETDRYIEYEEGLRSGGESVNIEDADNKFLATQEMENQWEYLLKHSEKETAMTNTGIDDSSISYLAGKNNLNNVLQNGLVCLEQLEKRNHKKNYLQI